MHNQCFLVLALALPAAGAALSLHPLVTTTSARDSGPDNRQDVPDLEIDTTPRIVVPVENEGSVTLRGQGLSKSPDHTITLTYPTEIEFEVSFPYDGPAPDASSFELIRVTRERELTLGSMGPDVETEDGNLHYRVTLPVLTGARGTQNCIVRTTGFFFDKDEPKTKLHEAEFQVKFVPSAPAEPQ